MTTTATATIPLFKVAMSERAGEAVAATLRSGYVGQGPRVEEFEAALARRIGNPLVLSVNSCTSALHLALHLLMTAAPETRAPGAPAIERGDEVLTTALTCTATNWPILANGLRIRWVDVDPATLNLDPDDLLSKVSPATKVIVAVHWGGYPADLDRIAAVRERCFERFGFRPYVVEDCAHAWSAEFRGKPLGNHGNLCAFSFQAIKHLTCGDGGALVVPDPELYRRGKLLRWYGIDREKRTDPRNDGDVAEYGFKFHMNDINATIGLENLAIVDAVVARHRANARYYDERLRGVPGLTLLQQGGDRVSPAWIYTVLVEDRAGFERRMAEAGIAVSPVHGRNDTHQCVAPFRAPLPALDAVAARMVAIPVGWWVGDDDREHIAETIRRGW